MHTCAAAYFISMLNCLGQRLLGSPVPFARRDCLHSLVCRVRDAMLWPFLEVALAVLQTEPSQQRRAQDWVRNGALLMLTVAICQLRSPEVLLQSCGAREVATRAALVSGVSPMLRQPCLSAVRSLPPELHAS